jgi:hypothetical protein
MTNRICWQNGDFWFEDDSQIEKNVKKVCGDYREISNSEFPRYYSEQLPNISKKECFEKLNKKKYEFDYALPQNWLDSFVEKSHLEYHLVLGTTVWVYEKKGLKSFPVSCCVEVQREIEKEYSD